MYSKADYPFNLIQISIELIVVVAWITVFLGNIHLHMYKKLLKIMLREAPAGVTINFKWGANSPVLVIEIKNKCKSPIYI